MDNTIDMTSTYSHTQNEYNIIQFPKKPIMGKNTNIFAHNSFRNYDVYPVVDRFDPNISGSPPNIFVDTLKQRMDVYYANDISMKLNVNCNHVVRNRALSLSQ
jgi:hypothetical protein